MEVEKWMEYKRKEWKDIDTRVKEGCMSGWIE